MSGRPSVRARDCKQLIIGAKRAGATRVVFQMGGITATVCLDGVSDSGEIATENNNSFDKIMLDK
jgi:hypothetical protein